MSETIAQADDTADAQRSRERRVIADTAQVEDSSATRDASSETTAPDEGQTTTDGADAGSAGDAHVPSHGATTSAGPATSGAMAHDGNMIVPDISGGLPSGHAGSDQELFESRTPGGKRNPQGTAQWRTICLFSHMSFDDPIVFPGQAGASHLHTYFGNTDADAFSTAASIATSGDSTCAGGIVNRTGYWKPAILDARTRTPVVPKFAIIYYKSGPRVTPSESIQPMPAGLRMIAGNAKASGSGRDNPHATWRCIGDSSQGGSGSSMPHIPSDCSSGQILRLSVRFPQCWDGRHVDSADHKSHMAYPDYNTGCPASHPVPIPEITMNVDYVVDDPSALRHWRLASDAYDMSRPGGMSAHADWFNGWDLDLFNTVLDNCYRPGIDCGGTDNLNDGRGLALP